MKIVNDASTVSGRLAFARTLVERGLFQEADDLLTEAVARDGMTLLEVSEWIKIASFQGEHARALKRLDAAKAATKGVNWLGVEQAALLSARRFQPLVSLFQQQLQTREGEDAIRQKLSYVSSLMEIEKEFRGGLDSLPDYPAYCINLDEYDQKWKRCQIEGASANLGFMRIPGVRGSYLPDSVLPRLGKGIKDNFKGTLGCFLSHLRAWELFLESGKEHALIVEDDFRPIVRFPGAFGAFGLPQGFDICWINQRTDLPGSRALKFIDIWQAIRKKASPKWRACGADGYIISRSGARKLREYVAEDGLLGDVDWRMLAYSLQPEEVSGLPEQSFPRMAMEALLPVMKPRTPLRSYAASIGLVGLVLTGSSRKIQNSGGHVHESV